MNIHEKIDELSIRIDRIEAIQKEILKEIGCRLNLFHIQGKKSDNYIEKVKDMDSK